MMNISQLPALVPGGLRVQTVYRASTDDWKIEQDGCTFHVGRIGGNIYDVVFHDDCTWTCSCPDFQYRRQPCKHLVALWLRGPVTVIDRDGGKHIVPQSILSTQQGGDMFTTNQQRPASAQPVAQQSASAQPVA
ncbi:SWIM zinc finger family protein, partial [Thermogutta sp.]|uniref:SWIM zinc finger family protein n=1 Tax=Thermogutta sp. TaxID=1962930 RepID=UPI0032206461